VAVLAGAESWSHTGAAVGVLLCHGFTGTPQTLRGWGEQLATAGYSVQLPRLPGHGTTWQDANATEWRDWYGRVDEALTEIHRHCSTVFLGGISMGAVLALRLAIERPADVAGLLLVNPAVRFENKALALLPILRRVTPSFTAIGNDIKKPGSTELAYGRTPLHALASLLRMNADVAPRLPSVTQPLLVFRSAEDHVVPASAARLVLEQVSSTDRAEIVLEDSYHVATLDNDAERIVKESLAFISRLSGDGGERA
jgi:carboxylesterase